MEEDDMNPILESWKTLADGYSERLDVVGSDQWDQASNCDGWSVRDLVKHTIDVQCKIPDALGAGVGGDLGDDLVSEWSRVSTAAIAAFQTDGAMDKMVEGPMGEAPVAQALGLPSMDLLVHTFDLARSTGGDEKLPEDIVEHAFESIKPMDAMLRGEGMFHQKVEVGDDANLQTQFIAFTGRQP
ncbi:MAG: TIGR03086 family protein [Acidobacteria bacterium]|nr:TIGR03086 family protein [Acidobacteriota bacterium]